MNTPSPLTPQGSLQQQQSKGKSTFRTAVFITVAIHAVFCGGLLMQGCGDGGKTAGNSSTSTNLADELPRFPGSEYYGSTKELPSPALASFETNEPAPLPYQPPAASYVYEPPVPAYEPPAPVETKEYTVVRGDSLYTIAARHGIELGDLTQANPDLRGTRIHPGQKLHIPAPTPGARSELAPLEPSSQPVENGSTIYVVKPGDNLTKIAAAQGTTVKALRSANNLKTDRLSIGQKLKVPAAGNGGAPVANTTINFR